MGRIERFPATSVRGYSLPNRTSHMSSVDDEISLSMLGLPLAEQPTLQLVYETAPIGLALLSPDCSYLQINQRLTEICGISVEDHLGRSVRECVPAQRSDWWMSKASAQPSRPAAYYDFFASEMKLGSTSLRVLSRIFSEASSTRPTRT